MQHTGTITRADLDYLATATRAGANAPDNTAACAEAARALRATTAAAAAAFEDTDAAAHVTYLINRLADTSIDHTTEGAAIWCEYVKDVIMEGVRSRQFSALRLL